MRFQIDRPDAYRSLTKLLKRLAVAVTLILAVIILILALSPSVPDVARGINDRILHFAGFAALVLPCAIFLVRYLVWIVPSAVMFGGAIELLQPGFARAASWADFLADACGVAAGVLIGLALRALIKRFVAAPK